MANTTMKKRLSNSKRQLITMTALGLVFQYSYVNAQVLPPECNPNPAVNGANVVCTSANDVDSIATTSDDLTLTIGSVATPTDVVTTDAIGVSMNGFGAQNFNLINSSSSVSAADIAALILVARGGGNLTVNNEGILTARWAGLETRNFGNSATTINLTGIDLAAEGTFDGLAGYIRTDGVRAINYEDATDLIITSTGTINARNDGIWARNFGSGDIIIDVENINSLNNRGLTAIAEMDSGDIVISVSGLISSTGRDGVFAWNDGRGDTDIDVNNITLTGGGALIPTPDPVFGIHAENQTNARNLTVIAIGLIDTLGDGIFVRNFGTGTTQINVADITSENGRGITAITNGTSALGINITATGLIDSGDEAIYVENNAGEETLVTVNSIRSAGGTNPENLTAGIRAVLTGDAAGLRLTATGDIETAGDGINVFNSGRRDTQININNLTTSNGTGIVVEQEGQTLVDTPTDVTIDVAGRLQSNGAALTVINNAFGDVNIDMNEVNARYVGSFQSSFDVTTGSFANDLNLDIDRYDYILTPSDGSTTRSGIFALTTFNDGQGSQTVNLDTAVVSDTRINPRRDAEFNFLNSANADALTFVSDRSLTRGDYTVRNRGLGDTTVNVNQFINAGLRVEHDTLAQTGNLTVSIQEGSTEFFDINSDNAINHIVNIDRLINSSFSSFADRADLHQVIINSIDNDINGPRTIRFRTRYDTAQSTFIVNSVIQNTEVRINHFSGAGNLDVDLQAVDNGSLELTTNLLTDSVNLLVRDTVDDMTILNDGGDLTINVMGDGRGHANIINRRLHPTGNPFANNMNVQLGFMDFGADIRNDGDGDTIVVSGGAMPWFRAEDIGDGDRFIFAGGLIRNRVIGIQNGFSFNDRGDAALRVLGGHVSDDLQLTTTGAVTGFEIVGASYGIPDALHVMNFGAGTTVADIGGDVTGDGRAILAASKEGANVIIRDGVTITGGDPAAVAAVNPVIVSERPVGAVVFGGLAEDTTLDDYYTAFDHVPIQAGRSDRNTLPFAELTLSAATDDTLVLESNVTINGDILFGAGDDTFQTMTSNYDLVNGEAGVDSAAFFGPGFTMSNVNNTGGRLQGFEHLSFNAGGYTLSGTFSDLTSVTFNAGMNVLNGTIGSDLTTISSGAMLSSHAGTTVDGNLVLGGILSHGGQGGEGLLSILGDYTQASTGQLHIDLRNGNGNVLSVAGSLDLAGTLSLQQNNAPAIGNVTLMDGLSLAGTFDTVNGLVSSNALIQQAISYDGTAFEVVLNTSAAAASISGLRKSEISLGITLAHGLTTNRFGGLAAYVGHLETDSQIKDALADILPTVADTSVVQFQSASQRHAFSMLGSTGPHSVNPGFAPQHVSFNQQSLTPRAAGPAIWSRLQTTTPVASFALWDSNLSDTEFALGLSGLKVGGLSFGAVLSHLRQAKPLHPVAKDDVSTESVRMGFSAQYPIAFSPEGPSLSLEAASSFSSGRTYAQEDATSNLIPFTRSEEANISARSSAIRLKLNGWGQRTLPLQPYMVAGSDSISRGVGAFGNGLLKDGHFADLKIGAIDQTRSSYGIGAQSEMNLGGSGYLRLHATTLRYFGDTASTLKAQFKGVGSDDLPDFLISDTDIRQQSIVDARLGLDLGRNLNLSVSGLLEFGDRPDHTANLNITKKW